MSARVLVVEDEEAIADAIVYSLGAEGFAVEAVDDGEAALEAARGGQYDLLILDLMLPGLSGLEVCRRLRAESSVPILMLTARTAEVDRVVGLDAGADDYVQKPFSMPELISRVRAILRRRELDLEERRAAVLEVGRLRLDLPAHSLTVDGQPVRLTPSEFRLLSLLMKEPGRVFTRRELMQHLWESSYVGDQRAADVHVANLRRKIDRDGASKRLVTVRGAGYMITPDA